MQRKLPPSQHDALGCSVVGAGPLQLEDEVRLKVVPGHGDVVNLGAAVVRGTVGLLGSVVTHSQPDGCSPKAQAPASKTGSAENRP